MAAEAKKLRLGVPENFGALRAKVLCRGFSICRARLTHDMIHCTDLFSPHTRDVQCASDNDPSVQLELSRCGCPQHRHAIVLQKSSAFDKANIPWHIPVVKKRFVLDYWHFRSTASRCHRFLLQVILFWHSWMSSMLFQRDASRSPD